MGEKKPYEIPEFNRDQPEARLEILLLRKMNESTLAF
jgi:hypothetical protein